MNIVLWTHFDLSNVTQPEVEDLKKLAPAPNIPIDQLRVKIANFRHIRHTMLEEVQDLVYHC